MEEKVKPKRSKIGKFYRSDRWHDARRAVIRRANGRCEKCGAVGTEVHHIVHLTNENVDDPNVSINLKAASLPGQKYHVIIPMNNQKDTEIYAPDYKDGTKLALVRYPHGGIFEIPVLTVNNKNAVAKKMLGTDVSHVVGITSKVADSPFRCA